MGVPEKIKRIEEEIQKTQVNKKTEHHLGLLRAKLAKLRKEQEEARSKGKSSSIGYSVKKNGDATVVIIGLPNVGKSTLLNRLTNSKSKVGEYQFTTLTVVPGIMEYKGATIQMLDIPGIIEKASSGKGLGKRVLSVARSADLILYVVDVFRPNALSILDRELHKIGIRVDKNPPDIIIEKTSTGGISVISAIQKTRISNELVKGILRIYGINNARVMIREDIKDEQFVDIILGNRTYIPSLTVMNKIDLVNAGFIRELQSSLNHDFIPISGDANLNLQDLKEKIYQKLDFIRIYMRPKKGETDFVEPIILKKGSSVIDVCNKIHRGLKEELRYAQIWGKSAKYGGQRVGLNHSLMDEDVLTFITN
jgi:small GTP-binding protein